MCRDLTYVNPSVLVPLLSDDDSLDRELMLSSTNVQIR